MIFNAKNRNNALVVELFTRHAAITENLLNVAIQEKERVFKSRQTLSTSIRNSRLSRV